MIAHGMEIASQNGVGVEQEKVAMKSFGLVTACNHIEAAGGRARRLPALALAIATAASVALTVAPARATPVVFTFTPDAAITDTAGVTETIGGGFTFDPSADALTNIDITISGSGSESGLYDQAPSYLTHNHPNGIEIFAIHQDGSSSIRFDLIMNEDASGNPTTIGFINNNYFFVIDDNSSAVTYYSSVAGGVTTDAPEPASLAVLSGGMIALGMMRRRRAVGPAKPAI